MCIHMNVFVNVSVRALSTGRQKSAVPLQLGERDRQHVHMSRIPKVRECAHTLLQVVKKTRALRSLNMPLSHILQIMLIEFHNNWAKD